MNAADCVSYRGRERRLIARLEHDDAHDPHTGKHAIARAIRVSQFRHRD